MEKLCPLCDSKNNEYRKDIVTHRDGHLYTLEYYHCKDCSYDWGDMDTLQINIKNANAQKKHVS